MYRDKPPFEGGFENFASEILCILYSEYFQVPIFGVVYCVKCPAVILPKIADKICAVIYQMTVALIHTAVCILGRQHTYLVSLYEQSVVMLTLFFTPF